MAIFIAKRTYNRYKSLFTLSVHYTPTIVKFSTVNHLKLPIALVNMH